MVAPVELTHDKTSVILKWMSPIFDGASPITSYVLYAKAEYESTFTEVYSGMTLFHNVTGLVTGFFH